MTQQAASIKTKKKQYEKNTNSTLSTRWKTNANLNEYPRPEMVRNDWINLNGIWDYAFKKNKEFPVTYDGQILVPYSPESQLSGVQRQLQIGEYLWYHRKVDLSPGHYLLHFEAVDCLCKIYIDDQLVKEHIGGYLPFTIELNVEKRFDLKVCVQDDSDSSYHARGKQKLKRGGMYYTAQSGIWQSVWMEAIPEYYISDIQITADIDHSTILIQIDSNWYDEFIIRIENEPEYHANQKQVEIRIENMHLWTVEDPYLYQMRIFANQDQVCTYFACRKVTIEKDQQGYPRICLNHQPVLLTGVLDQGYYPESLMTPPSDEAMIYDISTMKELGYNLIRKHIKIENRRWYYHCDRMGMLVWQDMVNGGSSYQDWFVTYLATVLNPFHFTIPDGKAAYWLFSRANKQGRKEFQREIKETIEHLKCHPCIICWVLFNEGWGQFDTRRLTDYIHILDHERLIDSSSGWFDQNCGDFHSFHHYFLPLYFRSDFKRVLVLSEFGGYTLKLKDHLYSEELYGYGGFENKEALSEAIEKLYEKEVFAAISQGMSAFVYTQLSDIEDELNGILTYDRQELKVNSEIIKRINKKIYHYSKQLETEREYKTSVNEIK